jgi:hypothetical protein
MLINKNNNENIHVKFVSYTGSYPNLCSGVLTLEIDGIEYTFGNSYKKPKSDFNAFWTTGGCVSSDKNWNFHVGHDEWKIDVNDIPEQFRKYATEIDDEFNNNVEYGCCGGCI